MSEVAVEAVPVPGGCDTHVHVVGEPARYPMVADRHYTPGPAGVEALRAHLAGQGLTRAVIVQPSVYGTDNACLLEALGAMRGDARGVAVVAPGVDAATLQALETAGVRGLRINLESAGGAQAEALRDQLALWGPRLAGRGWHLQVYAPLAVIAACEPAIRALPVPLVLDHVALWPDATSQAPACRTVLALLEGGGIYIKLSGSYRVPLPAEGLRDVARHLAACRPDRLLWASDWPHTNREPGRHRLEVSRYRDIPPAGLRQEREAWLGDPRGTLARQVLVENPQRLYRF